jgi:hypothetical protein
MESKNLLLILLPVLFLTTACVGQGDTIPPAAPIFNHVNGTTLYSADVMIIAMFDERVVVTDEFIDGKGAPSFSTDNMEYKYQLTGLSNALHVLRITAKDEAGNGRTVIFRFTVEAPAAEEEEEEEEELPALRVTFEPADGEKVTRDDPTIELTFNRVVGITEAKFDGDDLDLTTDDNIKWYDYSVEDLAEGSHTISVKAEDSYGNRIDKSSSFTVEIPEPEVDTTAPTTSNGAPEATNDDTPQVKINTNEAATCKFSLDDDESYDNMDYSFTASSNGKTHTYTFFSSEALDEDTYEVYVRCKDESGNKNSASYSWVMKVDLTPPVISDPVPRNGSVTTGTTPELSVDTDEEATCKGSIDNDESYDNMDFKFTASSDGGTHTYTITSSDEFEYGDEPEIYVKCRDAANNEEEFWWTFSVSETDTIEVEWNETSISMNVAAGSTNTSKAEVESTGINSDVEISRTSGQTWITHSSDIGNMDDEEVEVVTFQCAPPGDTAGGTYSAVFKVSSDQDTGGDEITINCVIPVEAEVEWNPSSVEINTVRGTNKTGTSDVESTGSNTGVTVTKTSGGDDEITANYGTMGSMGNGASRTVTFTCDAGAAGSYLTTFKVVSNEDATEDIVSVSCDVIAEVDWESASVGISTTNASSDSNTDDVTASGDNTGVTVTPGDGDEFITANPLSIENLDNGNSQTVTFICTGAGQAPGTYSGTFRVTSDQDATGDEITVNCEVTAA